MDESILMPPPPPTEPTGSRRRKLPLLLLLGGAVLILIFGIWLGTNSAKPGPTEPKASAQAQIPPETTVPPAQEPWVGNILRSDPIPLDESGSWVVFPTQHTVLGSGYRRDQIASVTFLSTLENAPDDAWDVSESKNGTVLAWVEPEDSLYRLYIAGEGGVMAGTSCYELFAGYSCVRQFRFGDSFHTDRTEDMTGLFHGCASLTSLDLSGFDTARVRDMHYLFLGCLALTSLNLSSFDTANVQDMNWMFGDCNSLTSVDLSSFDTAKVENMRNMFYGCNSLTALTLSNKFVTGQADTTNMFAGCPAGDDWQHLMN